MFFSKQHIVSKFFDCLVLQSFWTLPRRFAKMGIWPRTCQVFVVAVALVSCIPDVEGIKASLANQKLLDTKKNSKNKNSPDLDIDLLGSNKDKTKKHHHHHKEVDDKAGKAAEPAPLYYDVYDVPPEPEYIDIYDQPPMTDYVDVYPDMPMTDYVDIYDPTPMQTDYVDITPVNEYYDIYDQTPSQADYVDVYAADDFFVPTPAEVEEVVYYYYYPGGNSGGGGVDVTYEYEDDPNKEKCQRRTKPKVCPPGYLPMKKSSS